MSDGPLCDGSRGAQCVHQDPAQCHREVDCPAFAGSRRSMELLRPRDREAHIRAQYEAALRTMVENASMESRTHIVVEGGEIVTGLLQTQALLQEQIRQLEQTIADLKTVMVAAAEEISQHWDAHCGPDGYGPANLLRRLENGIPSKYAYTAGDFAALRARVLELEAVHADASGAVLQERERCAAIARRWGETHADGETVNARNAASKIARGIEGPNAE